MYQAGHARDTHCPQARGHRQLATMPLFGSGFEAQKKLKPNLKMACQRMAMVINKKTNMVKRHKGGIVDLIKANKIDKANIKVRCLSLA